MEAATRWRRPRAGPGEAAEALATARARSKRPWRLVLPAAVPPRLAAANLAGLRPRSRAYFSVRRSLRPWPAWFSLAIRDGTYDGKHLECRESLLSTTGRLAAAAQSPTLRGRWPHLFGRLSDPTPGRASAPWSDWSRNSAPSAWWWGFPSPSGATKATRPPKPVLSAERLAREGQRAVELYDERLTTRLAERDRRQRDADSRAAAHLLESYLAPGSRGIARMSGGPPPYPAAVRRRSARPRCWSARRGADGERRFRGAGPLCRPPSRSPRASLSLGRAREWTAAGLSWCWRRSPALPGLRSPISTVLRAREGRVRW